MATMHTRTLTANAGGAITPMYRRDGRGDIVEVMPDRDEYVTPPRGMRARLQLSGISDVFEMTTKFSDTPVSKVRVEYMVEKGTSNAGKTMEGKRFTELQTWTIGPKSNLGMLIGALRSEGVRVGEEINPDDYIGTSFVATVTTSDDGKWARVVPDAIEEGSVRLPASAPAATPVTPAGDEDPFDEEL